MIVSYKKLWKLLIDKDMTKTQLRIASGVSSSTMAKMTRGEDIRSLFLFVCARHSNVMWEISSSLYQMTKAPFPPMHEGDTTHSNSR